MADPVLLITAEETERLRAAGLTDFLERLDRFMGQVKDLFKLAQQQATQIQELKARLGQHSQNSSKPPSQDPPGARPGTEKGPGGGKPGARPGHKGTHRDLLSPEQVDAFVTRDPEGCDRCGQDLSLAPRRDLERWQVTELPEIRPQVTEFQLGNALPMLRGHHMGPASGEWASQRLRSESPGHGLSTFGGISPELFQGAEPPEGCVPHLDVHRVHPGLPQDWDPGQHSSLPGAPLRSSVESRWASGAIGQVRDRRPCWTRTH